MSHVMLNKQFKDKFNSYKNKKRIGTIKFRYFIKDEILEIDVIDIIESDIITGIVIKSDFTRMIMLFNSDYERLKNGILDIRPIGGIGYYGDLLLFDEKPKEESGTVTFEESIELENQINKEQEIIDFIAHNMPELLRAINENKTVEVVRLDTIKFEGMSLFNILIKE